MVSWGALTILVGILIGIAFGVLGMNPAQYVIAQVCFITSAVVLAARVGWWLAIEQSAASIFHRSILSLLIFGLVGVLCVEAVSWTQRLKSRQQQYTGVLNPVMLLSKSKTDTIVQIRPAGATFRIEDPGGAVFTDLLGESRLTVERVSGRILVSTVIRDAHGRLVAELVRNEWSTAQPPTIYDRNYSMDALEVRDDTGDVVLQIRALPDRIQLQGKWYYANGKRSILLDPAYYPGNSLMMFAVESTVHDPQQTITSMFKYPSSSHLGELVHQIATIKSAKDNERLGQGYVTEYSLTVNSETPLPILRVQMEGRLITSMAVVAQATGVSIPGQIENKKAVAIIRNAQGEYRVSATTTGPDRVFIFHEP
jgi:hypothetical protein